MSDEPEECFSCHLDGVDGVQGTKKLHFQSSSKEADSETVGLFTFDIWVCDSCFDARFTHRVNKG